MACSVPRHTYDSVILGFDVEVKVHIHSLGIFWGLLLFIKTLNGKG